MERGRIIAARATRERDLARYVAGKKVKVTVALSGHALWVDRGRVKLFYVDGVQIAHQNQLDDDYPSEGVMAVIAMAVNATVGTEGIPPVMDDSPEEKAARDQRNAYRDKYLGAWRQAHGE